MYVSLLIVGVLVAAAGFVTIGFGIPINAFSLGNTLIIAGTTAVAGGLVLIGLAAVVRQLHRIAEGLSARAPARPARPAEAAETAHVPPTARMTPARAPAPPRPPEPGMPRPATERPVLEPRFPATAASEESGPLDWLRKPKASGNGEPPVVEVSDEAPLSPRTPPRAPTSEPAYEPKAWSPGRSEGAAEPKPVSRSEQIARVANDRPKDNGLFDVVWPEPRPARPSNGAPDRNAQPEAQPQPREEPAVVPRSDQPTAAERPVAILKSGVIDGMAYTLYADGAIEAELPQGTVKFASVDALRAHLEKNS